MINLIFTLLVLLSICISLLTAGFLALWHKGADSVALPSLGIIVATPFLAILLTVLQFLFIIAAIFVSRFRPGVHTIVGL